MNLKTLQSSRLQGKMAIREGIEPSLIAPETIALSTWLPNLFE